jgi:hypothetical protein
LCVCKGACDLFPVDCGDLGENLTVGRVDDRQPLTAFDPVAVNIYGMSLHMNTLLRFILLEAASNFMTSMIMHVQYKQVVLYSSYFLGRSTKIINRS